jgi:hypothetical protein
MRLGRCPRSAMHRWPKHVSLVVLLSAQLRSYFPVGLKIQLKITTTQRCVGSDLLTLQKTMTPVNASGRRRKIWLGMPNITRWTYPVLTVQQHGKYHHTQKQSRDAKTNNQVSPTDPWRHRGQLSRGCGSTWAHTSCPRYDLFQPVSDGYVSYSTRNA